MTTNNTPIALNFAATKDAIAAACVRCNRSPDSVRLLPVSKTVSADVIRGVLPTGIRCFGENRVVDGLAKVEALADEDIEWHFIGHLQRNKVKRVLTGFRFFHGIDSVRLAESISREAVHLALTATILLEVNVSGETSKHGFSPAETGSAVATIAALPGIDLTGLMTMAAISDDCEMTRPVFHGLRLLRDEISTATGLPLRELSMGMSRDFQVAIEEGATIVRIGSALFR